MTIAMVGAMGDDDVSLGVVEEEEATGAGAFVPGCLVDSSEKRAFWDLDGKHIQEITRTMLSTTAPEGSGALIDHRKLVKIIFKMEIYFSRITGGEVIMPVCIRILFYAVRLQLGLQKNQNLAYCL